MFADRLVQAIQEIIERRLRRSGVYDESIDAARLTGVISPTLAIYEHALWSTSHTDVNTGDTRNDADVLTWHAASGKWIASPPGMTNPMTAVGDMIRGGTAGAPTRLAIGTTGQVLGVSGGVPTWMATTSTGSRWEPVTNGLGSAPEVIFDGLTGDIIMAEVF